MICFQETWLKPSDEKQAKEFLLQVLHQRCILSNEKAGADQNELPCFQWQIFFSSNTQSSSIQNERGLRKGGTAIASRLPIDSIITIPSQLAFEVDSKSHIMLHDLLEQGRLLRACISSQKILIFNVTTFICSLSYI